MEDDLAKEVLGLRRSEIAVNYCNIMVWRNVAKPVQKNWRCAEEGLSSKTL